MKKVGICLALVASLLMVGCASTGLNSVQSQTYENMQVAGVLVEEKNPGLGAALGILPGGGSFYTGHYGIGFVNLLLWPISVFWEPINGYNASRSTNYAVSVYKLKKDKRVAMNALDNKRIAGQLDDKTYIMKRQQVKAKYSYGF